MAYFPNGTSGEVYMSEWCFQCMNWREDEEYKENWGCLVMDLHVIFDYDQCEESEKGRFYKQILEHFIPTGKDGFPCKCGMFIPNPDSDIHGQLVMFEERTL